MVEEKMSTIISVYIESHKVKKMDLMRGITPRSIWVKRLIEKEINKFEGG